jgi:1-acyl-sn-glycerol-3-phosphate acyltransferase
VYSVIRSLVFYIVFYGGTVFFVLGSVALMLLPRRVFRIGPDGWSRFHRRCARMLLGQRVVVEGDLPDYPVIYAIKHESFFEAIDLAATFDHPVVFAKEELYRIPLWGWVARHYGSVMVARSEGASALRAMLTDARRFAETGRPLVIFPEGTRVPHGTRPKLQSGFAGIYKMLGLPVVPVAVNTGPLYHRRWKLPGTITYRFGEAIPAGLSREEIEARVHAAINVMNSSD